MFGLVLLAPPVWGQSEPVDGDAEVVEACAEATNGDDSETEPDPNCEEDDTPEPEPAPTAPIVPLRIIVTAERTPEEALSVPLSLTTLSETQIEDADMILPDVKAALGYPVIVKPANLGSSVGVGLVKTENEDLWPLVEYVLKKDTLCLIEPQVQNLVEYNIAMIAKGEEIRLSAIERPKSGAELLDFREKYLSDSGGAKGTFKPSEGMLSLTRDINPDLPRDLQDKIHDYARRTFSALGKRGAPRIDFMSNKETGELWFNEINAIPGSYGFFLWEAAAQPLLFPELIQHLIDEATGDTIKSFEDPVPQDARLLPRR